MDMKDKFDRYNYIFQLNKFKQNDNFFTKHVYFHFFLYNY